MSTATLIVMLLVGFGFIVLALVKRRLAWAVPVAIIGALLIFYATSEIFAPDRIRGRLVPALWAVLFISIPIALLLVLWAASLWRKHALPPPKVADAVRANLAIALGAGAVVTFSILILQTSVQIIDYQQNLDNQRQTIRLALATQSDLSGLSAPKDPADGEILDMSGSWLRGKDLKWSSLDEVNFSGANFVFSDLSGALLRKATLYSDAQEPQRTDLRAASLYWSDLTEAKVGKARFTDADLRNAYLCGVDLTQANLTRADLRGAKLDEDPENKGNRCSVPGSLPPHSDFPNACWPDEKDAHGGCGAEARSIVCQRDGRVPKVPAPDPSERLCSPAK